MSLLGPAERCLANRTAQIRKADEARLHVGSKQHAKQMRSMPSFSAAGASRGMTMVPSTRKMSTSVASIAPDAGPRQSPSPKCARFRWRRRNFVRPDDAEQQNPAAEQDDLNNAGA